MRLGRLVLACSLLGSTPAAAQDQPTDEEMQRLIDALGADAEQQSPSTAQAGPLATAGDALNAMNPAMSFILDVAAAWFSDDEPLQTGGHDPGETGFNFQQLEWYAAADVDPFFRFHTNVVFATTGVEIEEAVATTTALPGNLQVRAGQLLTRFGRINPTHPHAWSFADQPWVIGKMLGAEGSRGLGAELSWLAPLPWFFEVVASATMADGECCARSFYATDNPGVDGLDDLLYTTSLKQFFDFDEDWSLLWGLSAQFGPNPFGRDTRSEIYGTDLYLRYRPVASAERAAVSWQTEALLRSRQVPGDALQDWGVYTQLVWSITPRWEVGARYETVDGVAGDPLDADWVEGRQRAAAQVTFYPSHFSRLRLQGSWSEPLPRDPIWAAMLNLELIAGAHGAHAF